MNNSKVYFRADGNSNIGLGHVFRSIALVDIIKEHYQCIFIIQNPSQGLKTTILEVCKELIEIPSSDKYNDEAKLIRNKHIEDGSIIVLDGYNFKTEYQLIIRTQGCKLVCIDDIFSYHFIADSIINHAGGVSINDYSKEPYTHMFLGLKYALLSKPFRDNFRNKNTKPTNDNLFICLGGADPNNQLLQVLKVCGKVDLVDKYHIVIGSAYNYKDEFEVFLQSTNLNIELHSNLTPTQMLECMNQCNTAITSPSTVSYEYLSTGGALYLIKTAENQNRIHSYFTSSNIAFDFANYPNNDSQNISVSIQLQSEIFDGKQDKRLRYIFTYLNFDYRKALEGDCKLYHDWANDPETRSQSFNQTLIPFSDHQKWFNLKLNSKTSELFIILENDKPIGQIRFEIEGKDATINYSIDINHRGKSLSAPIILKGIAEFKKIHENKFLITGFVKQSNIASSKAFKSIGFKEEIATEFIDSYKYIWQ